MDGSTALAVLGLEPGATKQQIKANFRALAKGAHPDASGAAVAPAESVATDAFVELRAAYECAMVDAPDAAMPMTPATQAATAVDSPVQRVATGSAPNRPHQVRSWIMAIRPTVGLDITDVASASTRSLRSDMISRNQPAVDSAEREFASLLANELAAA